MHCVNQINRVVNRGTKTTVDTRGSCKYPYFMEKGPRGVDLEKILDDLQENLKDEGYKIKKSKVYVKKTVDIDPKQLNQITLVRMRLNVTLRKCLSQALELWLKKYDK